MNRTDCPGYEEAFCEARDCGECDYYEEDYDLFLEMLDDLDDEEKED